MKKSKAEMIVHKIIKDLKDRSGFVHIYTIISEETKEEMFSDWVKIVEKQLKKK